MANEDYPRRPQTRNHPRNRRPTNWHRRINQPKPSSFIDAIFIQIGDDTSEAGDKLYQVRSVLYILMKDISRQWV